MAIFEADPDALQNLIVKLDDAEGTLGDLIVDLSQAGYHFLETFMSPQKPQVEDEFNRLIDHLRCARDVGQSLKEFLRTVLSNLQEEERIHFR